jgi:hypothetical protein
MKKKLADVLDKSVNLDESVNNYHQKNLLVEADALTAGARRKEYGHPVDNFNDIARMWSVILSNEAEVNVTPLQVVLCMTALKICRGKQGYKRDTFIDIAGYARCAEMIQEVE